MTITAGPSGTVATPDVQFQFSSTEPGVDYECQLTGPGQPGGFVGCTSPRDYVSLSNGAHVFSVRATDGAFTSPTVTRSFTVAALDTTITGGPPNPTNDTTPTFTFTGVNGAVSFQCRFDTATFAPCTSPFTPTVALSQGTHTFQVRALSASGAPDPTPASQTFVVDSVAPDTTITSGPSGTVASTSATFTFTSTESPATFQCALDGATFGTCPASYTGLSQGSHTFQVRSIDAATNTDLSPATRAWTVDTVAPDTTITGGPSGSFASTTATFTFTSTESPATFQCALDGGAFGPCPVSYTGLSQGSHTFQVRSTDGVGNQDASPATRTWTVDTIAPDTSILTGPTGSVSSTSATFTYSSTEGASSFVCQLDAGDFVACPASYTGLSQGSHTFRVFATDAAGNQDPSPATRTWTVDTIAPDTAILTGPTGSVSSTSATFTFSSTETRPYFQCSLDGAAFGTCPAGYTGLSQGAHTFSVRAVDAAGNQDATPATRTWTVDTVAPETVDHRRADRLRQFHERDVHLHAPPRTRDASSARSTVPRSARCPAGYTGLSQGAHTFNVRAIDAAGNQDATPATRTWTVDTVAPDTAITSGPSGSVSSTSATFAFTSTENPPVFQCSLDGAAFGTCPAGYTGLSQGAHTFSVRAVDAAGNQDATPATRTWTVDTIAPDTAITSGPSGSTSSTSATFTFSSTETPATFQCAIDGGGFGTCPASYTGLSQGAHTFSVRSTDAAGNQDASPATRTWTVDTVAPDTSITSGPSGSVSSTTATFTFSSTENPVTFQCASTAAHSARAPSATPGSPRARTRSRSAPPTRPATRTPHPTRAPGPSTRSRPTPRS